MARRPAISQPQDEAARVLDGGFWLVVAMAAVCGVLVLAILVDRWRIVGFIHLEPYRYSVVTDTPVLDGSLDNPSLTDPSAAWGVGGDPWGTRSMPWVFVVDGHGIVRAKYQGVMGSADVDVIVALIEQGG